MKRFTVILAIIMCVALTGCQSVIVIEKNEVSASSIVSEKVEVLATVTEMQYEDSWIFFNPALKMPQVFPEKYLVTISYEDILETFEDKTLYEPVEEGNTIQMILCKDYDKDGNLIKQTLQFPK